MAFPKSVQRNPEFFSGWWDDFLLSVQNLFSSIENYIRNFFSYFLSQEKVEETYWSYEAPPERTIEDIIEEKARKYNVPPNVIRAMIQVESGYDPYAVSESGAKGLMQLMDSTFSWLGFHPSQIFDVEANIEAGVKYLRYLWNRYGNLSDAIAAYNTGKVLKYRKTGQYVNQSYVDMVFSLM